LMDMICVHFSSGAVFSDGPWNAKLGNVTCYMTVKSVLNSFSDIIMGFVLRSCFWIYGCNMVPLY
jgi:hypothetical protein